MTPISVQYMQITLAQLLKRVLFPFLIIALVAAIVLQYLEAYLPASMLFTLIDIWVFSFGSGLIIIMNMLAFILRRHYRRNLYYWPAQLLLTSIIFIGMFFIILVVSGIVRWQAIKLFSGLLAG